MKKNLFDNLYHLQCRWEEQCSLKTAYTFGEEDIDLNDFHNLIKESYDLIKAVKENYIYKNVCIDKEDLFEFMELISNISQYAFNDNSICDNSENCAFTATTILAERLRTYAICYTMEERAFKDSPNDGVGVFYLQVVFDENENPKWLTYNVYEGNFDDVLKCAKQIAGE